MRIVMLSDTETKGGASIAAGRLAEALIQEGHQVTRIVGEHDGLAHHWDRRTLTTPSSPYWRGARFLLPERWKRAFNHSYCKTALNKVLAKLQPEVINVHNLHGAAWMGWQPDLLEVCMRHAPTVWTLHDMWSFTGRCAYNYDCRKFVEGCDASCPTPSEYPVLEPNLIERAWMQRQQLFRKNPNLVGVAPSHWLRSEASTGFWKDHRLEVIANGLPLQIYQPIDRKLAREALGLPLEDPVVMIAAADLSAHRKGGEIVVDILQNWSGPSLTLLTLGAGKLNIANKWIRLFPLGYVDHERTFNTGGVAEMVKPGRTGWIASPVSSEALAESIHVALAQLQDTDLRETCRNFAEREYGDRLQAERYLELFAELTNAKHLKPSL